MAEYQLSQKADEDLAAIFIYSLQNFGEAKAKSYLVSLHECLSLLAEQPRTGREVNHIRPGYFRHEHASHALFYQITNNGIFVVRVLHQSMKVEFHLQENYQ